MKVDVSKAVYSDVTINAVSEGNHRLQFTAARLELRHVVHTYDMDLDGYVRANEYHVSIEALNPASVLINAPLEEVQRPKYCAAMGDAAQEYVDVTVFDKFRWEEVWNRMWEARSK